MASPAPVRYALVGAGVSALSLVLLQALLAQRLERAQIAQMGPEVAFNLRLGELALERLPPAALSRLSGLPLRVGELPPTGGDGRLAVQAERLQQALCRQLSHCPPVLPAAGDPRGVWVALLSPLEPVWLFAPMRSPQRWPLDPLLLGLALLGGSVSASLLFLWVEVQRPLQRLEQALSQVGLAARPAPLAAQGTGAVRRLTGRFNAMVQRLDQTERERETMLAGIAHDLKSPITRLRLRLGLARPDPADLQRSEADLDALERITAQFLLFAGGVDAEPPVEVPLEQLLAELSAAIDPCELQLDLEPMQRWVQPTALGRAVGNLLDNALSHGQRPLRLLLRPGLPEGEGFRIAVWDCGAGIAPDQWGQALMPFQRLDRARGGLGHCGLGLAIAARVAAAHGGGLEAQRSEQGFAVVLQGRSLQPAA
ncbi:histidine kinase [Synechococcus sp. HJ21-Hayes]|jgi:two-component system osmolarity sensor histidine kinase EnvZ|uniref:ATP-binding protein n=1 Tax=unclassified Synechococcus TaxID=2626047 RepID=UPI0020CB986E|nr:MULTISPECIES: ATP-binding protein [unclassified Synechococcus]MCP9830507.1 histidine kinase [Synechococcus sp. JJ3a-Johnson]MCP9852303.1 histidine kinase [Synechococcus sp. HJ21-Hayes]